MGRDCVIIGGGIMGCAVGLRLAQAGASPVVLERALPGAEASSAAAGILSPHAEAGELGPALGLGLDSLALWAPLARELYEATGIDVGYRASGVIEVALSEAEVPRLTTIAGVLTARGLPVESLTGAEARALEPALAPGVRSALRHARDAQVEPRALLRALAFAAARAGCRFLSGKVVRRVVLADGAVRGVELDGEQIEAERVVVAAGSWSALVGGVEAAGLGPGAVKPARGQLVELDTRPPLLGHVIFGPRGYLVPRPDGRVLAGSTMEFVGYDKQVTAGGLSAILGQALELVPDLAAAPLLASWAGLRPFTASGLPFIGATAVGGLFLATGHFRNGILLAPITAEIVADAVLGRAPRYSWTSAEPSQVTSPR